MPVRLQPTTTEFQISSPLDLSESLSQTKFSRTNRSKQRAVLGTTDQYRKNRKKPRVTATRQSTVSIPSRWLVIVAAVLLCSAGLMWHVERVREQVAIQAEQLHQMKEAVVEISEQLHVFWEALEAKQKKLNRENRVFCEREVAKHYSTYLQAKLQTSSDQYTEL